ncbi:YjgB family protein [Shimazuella alba]|uniref:DUF4309 domain-containing protein n=1 Tax=Shimazuella alba TaxID=2690964 RepID=A0A6I4VMT1_9BACL|nr:YjgB family protein [Shimazuella alba]MXQ52343.1 DUF4309 domain-containing protein [Shimazuella alba]
MQFFRSSCIFFVLLLLSGCDFILPFQESKSEPATTTTSNHLESTHSSKKVHVPIQPKTINPDHQKYLLESLALAGSGKVIGSEFAANKHTLSDVKKKYGEPNAKSKDFPYYIYSKRNLDIGVGKDDLIYDMRSHDPKLKKITRSEVVKILGVPTRIKHNTGESIYIYDVNGFQLKLIYELTKDDPTIHHSSVYSEAAFKKQEKKEKKGEKKKEEAKDK